MFASVRLALILLLTAACFHDQAPPILSATGSEATTTTGAMTGSVTGTPPDTSTEESGTSVANDTGCRSPTIWYLDLDQDGHGDPQTTQLACVQPAGHVEVGDDCDDNDGARAPGLDERCDQKDNDCDPLVDEYSPMNTSCDGCILTGSGASSYAYCTVARIYADARLECQKRGGDLTVIDDGRENDMHAHQAASLGGPMSVWHIGINDIAAEGNFVWLDGGAVGFTNWSVGEPNDFDGDEDCGVIYTGDGSWNDVPCGVVNVFICEAANGP